MQREAVGGETSWAGRRYNEGMTRFAVAFLLTVAVAGCRSNEGSPAARPAAGPNVWAAVDGRQITRDDVEKAYRREGPTQQQLQQQPRAEEQILNDKLQLLNQMIAQELLLAKARELKVEVTDTELDNAYNEAKKNITDDQFNKELAGRNLTALQALGSEASVLCLVLSDFSAFEDGAVPVGPGIHSVTGYQPDLALFYLAADVLVFPTVDSRAVVGTPLSIFEALANGTPVVARRSPATARWDGIPGLRLVDTDTELIEVARDVAREGGRVPALAIASRCGGDVTPCCSSEQK